MKKQIRLNAFAMNCVAHQSPGLWTHPRDRTAEYNRLPYWIDLAKTLERGRFDGLFLADVLGVYDVYRRQPGRGAAQRHADAGQRTAAADPGDGGGHARISASASPATCPSSRPTRLRGECRRSIISPRGGSAGTS